MFPTCILIIQNEEQRLLAEDIYLKYKKKMFYIAYTHLHNKIDAEDAVSEAFTHIVDHIEKFEDSASNSTIGLISIITRRCAIRIFNKSKNIVNMLEEEVISLNDDFEFKVEDIIITREMIENLMIELSKLNKIYSDVLVMRYYYDFSYEEISKILGISSANARMRCTRALKTIKGEFEKNE